MASKQRQLPGGRTSVVVKPGTTPQEAIEAARRSETMTKAPGAVKGKGKAGSTAAAVGDDYDTLLAQPGEAGGGRYVGDGPAAANAAADAAAGAAPDMKSAQAEVLAKYTPEKLKAGTDADGRAMMPKGGNDLVSKFRAVFARDVRPDAPLGGYEPAEQSKRDEYMAESQRVAEAMRGAGKLRDSRGRFAKALTITTHGAVQLRGADGTIRETVRAPYRAAKTGRVQGNIETPITTSADQLTEAVDKRLQAYGGSLFQDRAGLSPRRLAAMRIAFALDRKERGWPIPDWGLTL